MIGGGGGSAWPVFSLLVSRGLLFVSNVSDVILKTVHTVS